MISLRNACKSFGDLDVLRDLNLDIPRGKILAIIGPTGTGKTTLLRLIGLLEKPTSGEICFDDLDTQGTDKARTAIRRRMSVVSQKPVVFNAAVYENVAYGLKVRGEAKTVIDEKVRKTLGLVGLSGYEGRNARRLSGGEVQRVAIARAVIVEPEALLLDEPSANLDPVSAAEVEMDLSRVIEELKTTVILATHDMPQGQRLADNIAVLMDGRISQIGAPQEVFNSPLSKEVARFVGVGNCLDGLVVASEEGLITVKVNSATVDGVSNAGIGQEVTVCIRPEDIILAPAKAPTSARNVFWGTVSRVVSQGPLARVEVDCGFSLIALVTKRSLEELDLRAATKVYASFKATGVHIIEKKLED